VSDHKITFARSARKELEGLSKRDIQRVFQKIESLSRNPRPPGCRKLVGSIDLWRIRVGNYRVIYSINDEQSIIDIIAIRHRSEAYR
jgi:mRNA interferase RelE/StbE